MRHNSPRKPHEHVCKRPRVFLHHPVVGEVAGSVVQGQRLQAPAARRRSPATSPPPIACTRPGPSDLVRAALIAYPFVLNGRSTMDLCTGRTVRSTVHAHAGSRWI
jgi:hypothetical protein